MGQREKHKKEMAVFKKNSKAQAAITIKVKVAQAVERKEQALTKALTAKHTKKLKAVQKEASDNLKSCQKKRKLSLDTLKTEMRVAVEKATDLVPKAVQKALADTKAKLAKTTEERDKTMSEKRKADNTAKEKIDDLETKKTKLEMKSKDCHAREASLRKELAAAKEKAKLLAVKLGEKDSALSRTKDDLQTTKRNLAAVTENLKAGEGALMAEISSLKKSRDSEMERVTVVSSNLQKCHVKVSKVRRDLNGKIVKLRETGQKLFTAKREIDKYKSKFETTQMAHTTVTEQYRNCNSKLELSMDRMKDAKVKFQGCEEAMRRMKTYNADQLNDKKMEVTRLRQQVATAKDEARKLAVSQREKAAAQALAKRATDKAVADALAKAQAKALAVKTNAQDAVDKAAKEAVKVQRAGICRCWGSELNRSR